MLYIYICINSVNNESILKIRQQYSNIPYNSESMGLKNLLDKLISYIVFLDLRIQNLHIIWQIFKIINALFMLAILLKLQFLSYIAGMEIQPIFKTVYNFLDGQDSNGNLMHEIGYAMGIHFVLLIISLIVYLNVNANLTNNQKQNKLITVLIYYPVLIIVLVQAMYSFIVCYLLRCLQDMSVIPKHTIAGNILGLVLLVLVQIYNHNNRIYSFLLFALVLCFKVMDPISVSIILIVASLGLLYKQKDLVSKSIYSCFIIVSAFKLLQYFQSENQMLLQNLLYLGVPLVLVIAVNISTHMFTIKHGSDLNNNKYLIQCSQKLQQMAPQNLQTQQILTIQHILINWMQKQKQQLPEQLKKILLTKQIRSMKYQQFIDLIDKKLKFNADKNNNQFQYVKQFIMFRVVNSYKIYQTIELIGFYMQKNKRAPSLKQQYIRKNLQFIIAQQFLSKQSDNEKINEMIKLSRIQQRFIQKSMQTFCNVFAFWEKIQMSVLIEAIIQDNFHTIINSFEQLKQIQQQLKLGYVAIWETKIVDILMKLIQPYSITKQQLEYASRHENSKEQTLVFFILRNRIITEVSPSFLKIVNCTHSEIINEDISKIMPQQIFNSIKFKEQQAINSSKVALVIPIVCGDDLIKIYQANIKLQPQSNQGVQFFYFFKKFQNQQKLAYLYINTIDLTIKYVSEEFYEKFCLQRQYSKAKIQKKDIFLNNIVMSYDPNILMSQLTKKKSLRCDFSTKALMRKKKGVNVITKFGGFMNLYSSFGNDALISFSITDNDTVSCQQGFRPNANEEKSGFESNIDDYKDQTVQVNNFKMISFMDNSDYKHSKQQQEAQLQECSEETKFCKINNPYKQKIQQKQTELSTQTKTNIFAFSTCAIVLSITLVLIMISLTSLLIIFSNQRQIMGITVLQNIQKSTQNTQLLIHGTIQVFVQEIVSRNYQYFQQYLQKFKYKNASSGSILKQLSKHIHQILYQFHSQFATFFQRKYISHPYQLIFNNFILNVNFNATNLIDYSYNIKLASQQMKVQLETAIKQGITFEQAQQTPIHPLIFLMKNYPTISNIQAPFQQFKQLQKQFEWQQAFLHILIATLSGLYVLIALLISFAIKRNLQTIKQIFYIFAVTQKVEIDKRLQQTAIGSNIYTSQVPKDSLKKIADLNIMKQKTMVLYESKVRHSMKVMKKQFESLKQDDEEKPKIIVTNKDNSYLASLNFFKGIIALTILFFMILGLFLYQIQIQLKQDKIMFKYKNQIEWLKFKQLKSSCDMYHSNLMKIVLNQTALVQPQIQQKQSSVYKFESADQTQGFQPFFAETLMILKQNLCDAIIKKSQILDVYAQCSNIGLGIFQKGFIQASQYYDFLTEKLKKGQIGLLQTNQHQVYPNLLIHTKTRSLILDQLQHMIIALQNNRVIKQQKASNTLIIMSAAAMVAISLTIVYIIFSFVPNLLKIKNVGIGYFRLFSKQTLGRMDVSAYINENRLLDKISLL